MLIILATISINAVLGENGIIRRAEIAGEHQANAEASDNAGLEGYYEYITNAEAVGNGGTSGGSGGSGGSGETGGTNPVAGTSATKPETWTNTAVSAIADGEGGVVPLPDNFYYVGGTKNTGLVISDKANDTMTPTAESAGNQFVWVPVDDTSFSAMFSGSASTTMTLCGSTGETTNYYSNLRVRSGDSSSYAATTPGTTSVTVNGSNVNGVREPDLVTSFDASTSPTYYSQAGFSSTTAMAEGFVTDYTNMRASIQRYKGFYIGRYELTGTTASPTVKPGAVLTAETAGNWYYLYKACRDVGTGKNNITTTMIWGCQWDETMNWLSTCGYNTDTDSSSWGNYSDSSGEADITGHGSPQNTGFSEKWSANHIYDLARKLL